MYLLDRAQCSHVITHWQSYPPSFQVKKIWTWKNTPQALVFHSMTMQNIAKVKTCVFSFLSNIVRTISGHVFTQALSEHRCRNIKQSLPAITVFIISVLCVVHVQLHPLVHVHVCVRSEQCTCIYTVHVHVRCTFTCFVHVHYIHHCIIATAWWTSLLSWFAETVLYIAQNHWYSSTALYYVHTAQRLVVWLSPRSLLTLAPNFVFSTLFGLHEAVVFLRFLEPLQFCK